MGRINEGTLRDWNDGDVMNQADYEQERSILVTAINDNYDRLIKQYQVLNPDGTVKTTQSLDTAINYIRFKEGNYVTLSLDNITSTLTIAVTPGAVDTTALKDGSVTTAKIADGNITTIKLVDLSVTTAKIAEGNVTTSKIADSNITTAKIADANVTTTKIADSSITTAKTANKAITTDKIADSAVTSTQLGTSAVTNTKVADGAITTSKIADNAITTAKIAPASITGDKIAAGVTSETINGARLDVIEANLGDQNNQTVTLKHGIQKITTGQQTPMTVRFGGDTKINLFPYGDCDDTNPWSAHQSSLSVDTMNKVSGNSSLKVTIQANDYGSAYRNSVYPLKAGKYYVLIAEVKNVNADTAKIFFSGVPSAGKSDSSKFRIECVKINPLEDLNADVALGVYGTVGNSVYFDEIRAYEFKNLEESLAFDSLTEDQIRLQYPFVKGIGNIKNPIITVHGRNEISPSYEWGVHANAVATGAYSLKHTATAAYQVSEIFFDEVLSNTAYTVGYDSVTAGARLIKEEFLADKVTSNPAVSAVAINNSLSFTTHADTKFIRIYFDNGIATSGTFTLVNPQLELGSVKTEFVEKNDSYLYILDEFASSVDGTVKDSLYWDENGNPRKNERIKRMDLDGSLNWSFDTDSTGFKRVTTDSAFHPTWVNYEGVVEKYDGKILVNNGSTGTIASSEADHFLVWSDGRLLIDIADTDSGWPEAWGSAEISQITISRLMNGWKLCDSAGNAYVSGSFYWKSVVDGSGITADANYTLYNYAPNFTPYKLQYQLAKPQDVTVQKEGSLVLLEGDNVVEVGEGVVVREPVVPDDNAAGDYCINYAGTDVAVSVSQRLKFREYKILDVYENEKKFTNYTLYSDTTRSFGNHYIVIPKANFDKTASYSVTYIAEKYQLTTNLNSVDATYQTNLKKVVDQNVQDISDAKTRLSIVENTYAKKAQGSILLPTFLNSWANFGSGYDNAGYYKDEFGRVWIDGVIRAGTIGQACFILPIEYRPKGQIMRTNVSNNGTNDVISRVVIQPNGSVIPAGGSNSWFNLSGISFRAEQ